MKYFNIFGERCSGTKYVRFLLQQAGLEQIESFGVKHWFIPTLEEKRPKLNKSTDIGANFLKLDDSKADETLFIVVARDPYQWLASFYKNPYHTYHMKYNNRYEFLTTKYHSSLRNPDKKWIQWEESFVDEAANIIDIRNQKHNHWACLEDKVKHFYIVSYDDLPNQLEKLPIKVDVIGWKLSNKYDLTIDERNFIDDNLDNVIDDQLFNI